MPLLEIALARKLMEKPQLTFNAYDLNSFVAHPGNKRSDFVPSLATGTMVNGQGSAVAPVTPETAAVLTNEVPQPTPSGAATFDSGGALPPVSPIQNQRVLPSAQPAPWISISKCAAANFKANARPSLGLINATAWS
jgi:hypothetical protein